MKAEPYTTFDGRKLTHGYLGADGTNDELDAWTEYNPDGWAIYRTGYTLRAYGVRREYLKGRFASFQEADQAWRRGGMDWDFDMKEAT